MEVILSSTNDCHPQILFGLFLNILSHMLSHGIHIICKWAISGNGHIIISFRHEFIGSIRATVYNKIITFTMSESIFYLSFLSFKKANLSLISASFTSVKFHYLCRISLMVSSSGRFFSLHLIIPIEYLIKASNVSIALYPLVATSVIIDIT